VLSKQLSEIGIQTVASVERRNCVSGKMAREVKM
jgi:hypothetical protein